MITFYSIIWTLINCIFMAFVIYVLRTRTGFLAKYGTGVLGILTIFCIIRILFPVEFPNHQYVIADSYLFAKLFKPINELLFPVFPEWFLPIVILLWVSGAIFHIIRSLIEARKTQRIISDRNCRDTSRGARALADIDPACRLPVRICPGIAVPSLVGYIRQGIYLPDYPYTDRELHYIVLHEYTHWKRKDIWKMSLVNLLCIFIWWNPAVHSIRKAFTQLLEYNCDKALSRDISEQDVVRYLDTLYRSLCRTKEPVNRINPYVISFISTTRKKVMRQRFDLLLKRNSAERRRLLPKIVIVLIGLLWMYCSYYFILQTNYEAPKESLFTANKAELDVIHIADDHNTYLVEQEDGTYLFYFNDFCTEVPASDVEAGMYDYYPIIKYEKDKDIIQQIISMITSWIPQH